MENLLAYYGSYGATDEAMTAVIIGLIIGVIVNIIIACATGHIASKKGRSYAGWWCLSFFLLGLIALIIAACISDDTKKYTQTQHVFYGQNADTWECEYCHLFNHGGDKCTFCGARRK